MKDVGNIEEISIAICDDEERWRKDIIELCNRYSEENSYKFTYREYDSGRALLEDEDNDCEILFLDVELKDMTGLEIKHELQKNRNDIQIMFVTSHNEVIQEAFGRNVYGFETKPIEQKSFFRKIGLMIDYLIDERKTIMVNRNGKISLIYLNDVVYIQADSKFCKIYTVKSAEPVFSDKSISFWKDYLEVNGFEMSMRSILVNLAYVEKIGQNEVIMKEGKRLELSRRMKKQFCTTFKDYVWKKGC